MYLFAYVPCVAPPMNVIQAGGSQPVAIQSYSRVYSTDETSDG